MESFTPISKITPITQSWKAKVQVVDKMRPRDSSSSTPTKYQNIILEDEAGTRVLAFIYNNDVRIFRDSLQLCKTYIITNAKVKEPRPLTKIPDSKYSYVWTITGSTPVADVKGDNQLPLPRDIGTIPFFELYKFIGTQSEIDILGVVIDKLPSKTVKNKAGGFSDVHEFLIVDEEAKPVILTMWTDFISYDGDRITQELKSLPVILVKRLSISLFHGMSLATKPNFSFHLNPSLKEAVSLRSWAFKNNQLLTHLTRTKAHQYVLRDLVNPYDQTYVTIHNIPSDIDKNNCIWIKARIMIMNQEQSFYYLACDNCGKATRAEYKEEFHCMQCTQETIAMPRFKFQVDIIDNTGSITVAIFGESGKKIFSLEANDIASLQRAGQKLPIDETNKKLRNETFIVQLRATTFEAYAQAQPKYNIAWLYDDKQMFHTNVTQLESSSKRVSRSLMLHDNLDETVSHHQEEECSSNLVSSPDHSESQKSKKQKIL